MPFIYDDTFIDDVRPYFRALQPVVIKGVKSKNANESVTEITKAWELAFNSGQPLRTPSGASGFTRDDGVKWLAQLAPKKTFKFYRHDELNPAYRSYGPSTGLYNRKNWMGFLKVHLRDTHDKVRSFWLFMRDEWAFNPPRQESTGRGSEDHNRRRFLHLHQIFAWSELFVAVRPLLDELPPKR